MCLVGGTWRGDASLSAGSRKLAHWKFQDFMRNFAEFPLARHSCKKTPQIDHRRNVAAPKAGYLIRKTWRVGDSARNVPANSITRSKQQPQIHTQSKHIPSQLQRSASYKRSDLKIDRIRFTQINYPST